MHKIANGHKGLYRFLVKTLGEAVHTGIQDWKDGKKGKNAIVEMARVIECINRLGVDIKRQSGRLFPNRKTSLRSQQLLTGV